ncbi:hypothetical protein SEUCBS139899_010079 [Sporothrix eucalyptigena]|uniref:Zn(2)-C6 fungal-type domain-containing protein n=1 Tax=Sporothrix eucalyptigena TaxID=1812306 RepID=A0ABP0D266_9PEZI
MPVQPKKGGSANTRSKSGCLTCRSRKVKCDEVRPGCQMCTRLRLHCDYASEEIACLHDRRLGAGPIKKRQLTNWRPQRIEPKKTLAPASSAALAATIAPSVPSPGPSVASMSTMSSLSSPSVSTTPPFMGTTITSSHNNNSLASFTTSTSEYTEFCPEDAVVPQTVGSNITNIPITAANAISHPATTLTDTAGLDFSTFVHDDLLANTSMRTPSPFSFIPAIDDGGYMFFGDLSTPLSPLLPPSTMALATTSCAASTSLIEETEAAEATACANGNYKIVPNSIYGIVPASTPSPLANLVLGTTTIVLNSFPSRMQLTERDYEALLLFHQHVGFSIGSKSPIWSTHAILIKLAVHHSAILHFLLSASFGELDWRLTVENGGSSGAAPGSLASLPAPASTNNKSGTPGQLARRHYEAGQAALNELAAAPKGTAEAGLYHVVVVACFWLEYLINRRHVPHHGRWASHTEFSHAMGDYMKKYNLRRNLMGGEALPSTSSSCSSSFAKNLPTLPSKCSPADDADDASSDEEDEYDHHESAENSNHVANNMIQTTIASKTITTPSMVVDRPMPPAKYRSFLSRLLSWLYWYDCAASFFGKGGGIAMQFRRPPHSQIGFYETARTTLLDFWDDYTPEEIADDNQNWPALQLINETWVAVHRLNLVFQTEEAKESHQQKSRRSFSSFSEHPETVADIARDVRSLRARYTTVFRLSAFTATSGGHRSRLLAMADWAVCHYLALELHLLRAGASREDLYGEEGPLLNKETAMMGGAFDDGFNSFQPYQSESSHPQAVAAQIVHLAERAIRTVGPVELDRFQWPLFWAGVETDNHVYRYFVLSNLINADFRAALQAVVREQTSGSVGGGPDLGYYATGSRVSIGRLRTICRAVGMAT